MSEKHILLWFEAPLQSWGFDSRFGRRETWAFPTKSGVLGLVCCAMGAGGPQKDFLARMSQLHQTAFSLVKETDLKGIRIQERLTDFHMVGSGYDDSDPWENLLIPKTNEGKKAVGGGTKLTYRDYLTDSVFAVILEVPEELAESIARSLQAPTWDLYLGRKCCVPTDLIYRGTYDDQDAAEHALNEIASQKKLVISKKVIDGQHPDEGDTLSINDVPVQFGTHKIYQSRDVTVIDLIE